MNQNPQNVPPFYVINRKNSGWAIASLVFGILGILGLDVCGGFILTIAFGHIALSQIPADVPDSDAGDCRYQSTGGDYLIQVGVDGGNLRSQSPDNRCLLVPESNETLAALECSSALTGTFTFRKNRQGGSELTVHQLTGNEAMRSKVQ